MAGSVNKVILVGNLGRDPEIRHFDNGGAVANFPLATTESYKNRETGERVTMPTDWHNVSVRKPGLVKVVESYVKKGQLLYIEGKLRTRTYEKDGDTKYITEVVADEFTMLGSKLENDNSAQNSATPAASTSPKIESSPSQEDDLPF
jgi:single-strand DNA-binding protein